MSKAIYDLAYYRDKRTNQTKSNFDYVSRDLRLIPRANNSDKSLSKEARTLATNYFRMIKKSANEILFVNSEFISGITEVGVRQNNRLHKELADIFHIKYHQIIRIDGKRYRDGFTIELTKNTEEILSNPKQFYSQKSVETPGENFLTSSKKCPQLQTKMSEPLYIQEKRTIKEPYRSTETLEKPSSAFEALKSNSVSKTLQDFYPLSQEDGTELQIMSGRDFALNAMNEILLDMSKRLTNPSFQTKKGFLSYMAKAFKYEKRDAVKTDNETFKIKANQSEEEKHADKMFKYLEKVENSLEVSPELHFKKKIACVLPDEKAYDLLMAYRSLVVKQGHATLYLRHHVELSPMQFESVLNQAQASHPSYEIEMLELSPSTQSKPQEQMENKTLDDVIIQKFGASKGRDVIANYSIKKIPSGSIQVQNNAGETLDAGDKHLLRVCIKEVFGDEVTILAAKEKFSSSDANELWKQFRRYAISTYYKSQKDADLIFTAWFEKLKATQNTADNKLILSGESFIIQHIDSTYSELVEAAAKELKINIELINERGYDKPILYKSGVGKFERISAERLDELMKAPFAI